MSDRQKTSDAEIEPEYRSLMNDLAQVLDEAFNGEWKQQGRERRIGFVLLVFPFNDHEGRCNYISNGQREDVVVLLREQLARFSGAPETVGRG